MKTGFKKLTIALSLVSAILLQCVMPAFAQVSQTVRFAAAPISAKKGDVITLPVKISSNANIQLAGVSLQVYYKESCLSYVDGSGTVPVSQMTGANVYNSTSAHRVSFAWTSAEMVNLPSETVIFNLQFKVLDTAVADSDVTLKILDVYTLTDNGGVPYAEDFTLLQDTISVDVAVQTVDGTVDTVISKIASIGTVTYSQESLNKILDAASAYAKLNDMQKQQVRNFDILSAAQVEYERLRIETEQSAVSAEVSNFMNTHRYVLALTTDTIKIEDEQKLLSAINAFNKLSKSAQYKIYSYNTLLKNLRTKLSALKKAEEDAAAAAREEATLRAAAQGYANTFKEEKKAFITMKPEDLVEEHYSGLNDAVENINMLTELNPYVEEYLKSEKIILTNLLAKVQDIIKQNENNKIPPEQLEADTFKNNFSYVLSQTVDTITADDALDIRLAYSIYDMLDPAVQALLTKEYTLLTALVSKVEELELLGDIDTDTDTDIEVDDPDEKESNTIIKQVGLGNFTMRFANRKMGTVVWVLLLLAILSSVVFGALQIFYNFFWKKRALNGPANDLAEEAVNL